MFKCSVFLGQSKKKYFHTFCVLSLCGKWKYGSVTVMESLRSAGFITNEVSIDTLTGKEILSVIVMMRAWGYLGQNGAGWAIHVIFAFSLSSAAESSNAHYFHQLCWLTVTIRIKIAKNIDFLFFKHTGNKTVSWQIWDDRRSLHWVRLSLKRFYFQF